MTKVTLSVADFMADFLDGDRAASDHYLDYQELKKDTKVLNQVQKSQKRQK